MVSSKSKGSGNDTSNSNNNGKVSATIRNRMRRPPPIQTVDENNNVVSTLPSSKGQLKLTKGLKKTPTSKKGAATPVSSTPNGMRGTTDIRSPGVDKTPTSDAEEKISLPDFITQTDKYGNASTPRTAPVTPTSPTSDIHSTGTDETDHEDVDDDGYENDACETLLESLRMMCCCLLPDPSAHPQDESHVDVYANPDVKGTSSPRRRMTVPKSQLTMREKLDPTLDIRLLPKLTPDSKNFGRKCLVLDLDETLVHSSFRAVQGADFVLPVQIEEVVHFVYVMKRPGVDEFLIEMAKHYEVVIYTASLNKYADPLLDLLDPHKTISHRLFRESCVFHEGNYVKDLSVLNRDLSQTIIVDNSPSSYAFHRESAIDCSSYIDDPRDVELNQIGSFLKGVRDVKDVRNVCNLWREWPNVPSHLMKRESTSSTLNEEDDVPGYWSGQQYLETRQDVGNRQ